MVRNYTRKSQRGSSYTKNDLNLAIDDVKCLRRNAYGASKFYNIPLNTLLDHVKGRRGAKSKSYGRATALSFEIENEIALGLRSMEKYGFGLSRKEVMSLVGDYVNGNKLKTPFKNGQPNKDWLISFMRRHNLSVKKPQSVEVARKKACDPFIINTYFQLLKETVTELGLAEKPHLIFNCDETSFCKDPSKTKVVGARGKACTRTTSTSGKENISVLLTISASGEKLPPLIIYKAKNMWDQWSAPEGTGYPGTSYAVTSNGWMETTVFENYFKNVFIKGLGDERPALLIFDGHSTHVGLKVIELARAERITILKLPPHSSHLLQPLDLCVMKSIKTAWDQNLSQWQRHHVGMRLPKSEFAKILGEIWKQTAPSIVKNSFEKGGIYPFNSKIIPEYLFDPTALRRWKESQKKPISEGSADTEETPNRTLPISEPATSTTPTNEDERGPSTSAQTDPRNNISLKEGTSVSFEELLLSTVKSHSSAPIKKKVRVANGAEIITSEETYQRTKIIESEKQLAEKNKIKRKQERETKQQKNAKKTKKNLIVSDSSDDDICSTHSTDDESLSELVNAEIEESHDIQTTFQDLSKTKIDDWVLVKFASKKSIQYFVGKVTSFDDDPVVLFTRKISSTDFTTTFRFPEKQDESAVEMSAIVSLLPAPTFTRRGDVCFQVTFTGYNVQ